MQGLIFSEPHGLFALEPLADHVHDPFDVGAWAKCEKVVNIGGEGHSELGVPEKARLIRALLKAG